MTTAHESPAVEAVNGSKPTLAPLAIFSQETVAAVAPRKQIKTRVKRAAWRRLLAIVATVWGDLRDAWFWDAAPPSISQVWRSRVVEYSAIPGGQHECTNAYLTESDGRKIQQVRRSGFWQLTCICSDVSVEDRKKVSQRIRIWFAMRWGWIVWNHLVAIPLTAALYAVAWIHQRPSRAFLAWSTCAFLWGVTQSMVRPT